MWVCLCIGGGGGRGYACSGCVCLVIQHGILKVVCVCVCVCSVETSLLSTRARLKRVLLEMISSSLRAGCGRKDNRGLWTATEEWMNKVSNN